MLPPSARQFDDVPLNVFFGEPVSQNRGPRLDSRCRLFAGLRFLPPFAENLEKLCVSGRPTCENAGNRVFCSKYWGAKGKCKEVQGNEERNENKGSAGGMKGKQSTRKPIGIATKARDIHEQASGHT